MLTESVRNALLGIRVYLPTRIQNLKVLFWKNISTTVLDTETSQTVLKEVLNRIDGWDFNKLHEILEEFRGYFKEQGIKPKVTMWTIRAALTGRTHGADMGVVLEVLGKDKVQYRIEKAIV